MAAPLKQLMKAIAVRSAQIAYPTGRKDFAVKQSFPGAFSAEEADPFLMCDHFGPMKSTGKIQDDDVFQVDWHPHRGFDILTYMIEGVGRHADSLGNRGEFASPGMQWISVGSGIEHAEAGGTPAGVNTIGFQIWVNVPSARKMEDPRYGTVPPENLPLLKPIDGVQVRVMAGLIDNESFNAFDGDQGQAGAQQVTRGPFETVQSVTMLDMQVEAGAAWSHSISKQHDNCLIYVAEGSGSINDNRVAAGQIIQLDTSDNQRREVFIQADADSGKAMRAILFSGKRLNQPIAWHGPFVMTTQAEIRQTIREYQSGTFLKVRAPFDYHRKSAAPADWDWSNPNPVRTD